MTPKIPKHAKKVFEGVIFDVYQWEQEQFDGTVKIFEAIRRQSTVEIIPVFEDGSIAIALEKQPHMQKPMYSLFGGRVEKDEDMLSAAKRELLEESGLVSDDWELYRAYDAGGSHKIDWQIHTYIARNCQKAKDAELDPGEQIEIYKCDFGEFIKIAGSQNFRSESFSDYLCRLFAENRLGELKDRLF